MREKKISIIGLPESGKTTFLAALWAYIQSEEDECLLQLDGYTKQYPHLNDIQDRWEMAERVIRTAAQSKKEAVINLKNTLNDDRFNLIIPDLSGEEFETQIANRKASKYYLSICNDADGFLVFISANTKNNDITHHDIGNGLIEGRAEGEVQEWEYKSIPYQVRLIEVLQFIINPPFKYGQRKISLIVSAWDTVRHNSDNPELWVSKEHPMLYQFLSSNVSLFKVRYYGVSAQGGDIDIPEIKERLLENFNSTSRIICQDINTKTNNITLPIMWVMSNESI